MRSVSEGKAFFSPSVSRLLVEDYIRQLQDKDIEDSYDLLTMREREILQLVAEGKSNKEVANVLNLSVYTVETHRGNILEELNLHSVPELILYAVRKGVISGTRAHPSAMVRAPAQLLLRLPQRPRIMDRRAQGLDSHSVPAKDRTLHALASLHQGYGL